MRDWELGHLGKYQEVGSRDRKWLKTMVGERGFEPPTPWSRTRFKTLLKFVGICCPQVIDIEPVAVCLLRAVELCGSLTVSQLQNRLLLKIDAHVSSNVIFECCYDSRHNRHGVELVIWSLELF
jgi:hypothetical protein